MVLLAIAVSFCLFFWSHMEWYSVIGGTISVGEVSAPVVLSGMGLAGSTCDFWDASVWFLGAGTFAACGLLPYMKIMFLLYSLFSPRKFLPVDARKDMLFAMDRINKVILVINMASSLICLAFTFVISGPIGVLNFEVDMYVSLDDAFYINIAAVVLIYLAGAFILYLHRVKEEPTIHLLAQLAHHPEAKLSLDAPKFVWLGGTKTGQGVIYSTLLLAFVLTVRGSFADSYCLELGGFLGLATGDGKQCYSVITSATLLPELMPNPREFGVQFTRALLVVLTFILPLCHMTMLLVLYATPLTVFRQWQLYYATEVVAAWSMLDLFCCGVLANSLEFAKFADAISATVEEELPDDLPPNFPAILTLTCEMNMWFASLALAVVCTHIMHTVILASADEMINARALKIFGQLQLNKDTGNLSKMSFTKYDPHTMYGGPEAPVISLREIAEADAIAQAQAQALMDARDNGSSAAVNKSGPEVGSFANRTMDGESFLSFETESMQSMNKAH